MAKHVQKKENVNSQVFVLILGLFLMFLVPICLLGLATAVGYNVW